MPVNKIIEFKAFEAVEVAASGTAYSQILDLRRDQPDGHFSMQVTATGSGTAKIEYELSNNGSDFLTPGTASDVVTAHTVGSDMYSISPMLAKKIRFKITETSTTDAITVSAWVAMQ